MRSGEQKYRGKVAWPTAIPKTLIKCIKFEESQIVQGCVRLQRKKHQHGAHAFCPISGKCMTQNSLLLLPSSSKLQKC